MLAPFPPKARGTAESKLAETDRLLRCVRSKAALPSVDLADLGMAVINYTLAARGIPNRPLTWVYDWACHMTYT